MIIEDSFFFFKSEDISDHDRTYMNLTKKEGL